MNDQTKTNYSSPVSIAYAEDHLAVRTAIVDYLERLGGIEVIIQAGNGRELIEKIAGAENRPQVCLVDIVMPELNGFETVTIIKRKWPDMKILILSGHLTEDYLIRMILSGVDGYLTKNADPLEIKKAVINIVETGWHNTDQFTQKFINSVRNGRVELPVLSGKEIQLLKLSIEDKTFQEIGALMNISDKSVEGHRSRLYTKLGVKTRAGLAMYAIRYGFVAIDPGASPL